MTRRFTLSEVTFTVSPEHEDMSVRDAGFENADGSPDEELIEDIVKRSQYNMWAWCTVKVTAKWGGFEGHAYLGGCSYDSEEDFKTGSGYYEDMERDAVNDLKDSIEAAGWKIAEDGEVSGKPELTEDEKQAVRDYLFCQDAVKDIAGTHVKRPDAFERVTEYLSELREKVG